MPTAEARAYSLQEQRALEEIAIATSAAISALFERSIRDGKVDEETLRFEYGLIMTGAMTAAAQTKTAYLQSFAQAAGKDPFNIPARLLRPTAADVLVPDATFDGAVGRATGLRDKWMDDLRRQQLDLMKSVSDQLTDTLPDVAERAVQRQATRMAATRLGSLAESTVMSTADFVQREVLGPDRRIAALRRVVHPGACDRCVTVAKVLVFKRDPALRHDQCRCSFEPVFNDDPAYRERIALYTRNSLARPGSRYEDGLGTRSTRGARFARYRGRRQLAAARMREESFTIQDSWNKLLMTEQQRLAQMVKTIPSNSYKDWAVMVSANQAEVGGGLLPVITRK